MPPTTPIVRLGQPAESDVCGQYRLHADCIADGERARPRAALLIEVDGHGLPSVRLFGPAAANARERIATLARYAEILIDAISVTNAEASN